MDEDPGLAGLPGYQHEINESAKTLKLWVRRKRGNRKLVCSGCGRRVEDIHEVYEREVRDLPCFEFRTTVVTELYRLRCPSKAPFSKRFEDAVGLACESAPGGAAIRLGGKYRTSDRSALLGTLECGAAQASAATDGVAQFEPESAHVNLYFPHLADGGQPAQRWAIQHGVPQVEVSAPPTLPSPRFRAIATRNLGLAVANLSESSAVRVNARALDTEGKQLAETSITLASRAHRSLNLSDVLHQSAIPFFGLG